MSSSPDLELGVIAERAKAKQTKKKKQKKAVVFEDGGKNEGDDPQWAYQPPEGASLLDHAVDVGAFDWDAVNDDPDTELWLIRIPNMIKPKHLKGLEMDHPSSSRTARIGGLTRKDDSYDVWSLADDNADVAGGEELRGLSCLLPRKSMDGKLYMAPKRVSRHIVISARPPTATPPEDGAIVFQNPPRSSYPKELLKHTFVPYGARSAPTETEEFSLDVDGLEIQDKPVDMARSSKGKKRKGDGDLPKKSKKHKPDH